MDLWLIQGAERFRRNPEVSKALLSVAKHPDSRECLILLGEILETPHLAERLLQVLRPEKKESGDGAVARRAGRRKGGPGKLSTCFVSSWDSSLPSSAFS